MAAAGWTARRGRLPPPAARAAASSGGTVPWLALRFDQPVAAVPAPVDDVHVAGVVAAEDKEVVSHELELQRRLLGAHRLHRKLFRLDDLRAGLVVGDA